MTGITSILEVFKSVLTKIEGGGVDYMVVGSLASIVYGEPRMTKDMDIVVDVRASDAIKFEQLP